MAKYILKAFFLTTFPSTQKKFPKIYAVTLVFPLKKKLEYNMDELTRKVVIVGEIRERNTRQDADVLINMIRTANGQKKVIIRGNKNI